MASAVSVGTVRAAAESSRDAESDRSGLRTSVALEADPGNAARWLFQEAVLVPSADLLRNFGLTQRATAGSSVLKHHAHGVNLNCLTLSL